MPYKHKIVTHTSKVLEYLRKVDDFRTTKQLKEGLTSLIYQPSGNQILAALHSLVKYKAVAFMESNDRMYWYATAPEEDTRIKTLDERTPESKPRKRRPKKQK